MQKQEIENHKWHIGIGVLVLAYLGVVLKDAWLADDAYITFRAAHNFVNGFGPNWNVSERVQGFTHPLWMFLLSGSYWLTGEIFYTSLLLSVIISLGTVLLLISRLVCTPTQVLCALSLMICSKAFVDFSTSGLENPLTHLLLAVFLMLYLQNPYPDDQTFFYLFFVSSLALINRMDTGLIYAPTLLVLMVKQFNWSRVGWMVIGCLPFLIWELFSIIYYGFPFPNTAYAKLNTGILRVELIAQGWSYIIHTFQIDPVTPITILVGIIISLRNRVLTPISIGVLLYLCYIIWIGGDFMVGRFLTAPFFCGLVLIMHSSPLSLKRSRYVLVGTLFIGLLMPRSPLRSGFDYGHIDTQKAQFKGIADERAYYYAWTSLWHPNLETHAEALAGRQLGGQNQVFAYHFVLGYYGFFAGSIPYIVDGYGLTDPLLSRLYPDIRFDIVLGTFGMEPRAKPWRIGHFPRKLPEGYLESLKTGQNQITDTNLSQYYEHLKWAVRGNIWSKARFREIWRLNTGYYTDLIAPRLLFLRFQRQAAWHISNGQIEAASRELEQARNLRPKHFENLFWLACIYQHLDQKDQALEALHQVLKADPSFLPAVFNKTLILVQTGQITQALADFKTMIRKQPDALSTLRYLIPKLTELGQDKAANLFYQEALIINPALRLE